MGRNRWRDEQRERRVSCLLRLARESPPRNVLDGRRSRRTRQPDGDRAKRLRLVHPRSKSRRDPLESYSAVDSALESREFPHYIPVSLGIRPKGLSDLAGMLNSQAGCRRFDPGLPRHPNQSQHFSPTEARRHRESEGQSKRALEICCLCGSAAKNHCQPEVRLQRACAAFFAPSRQPVDGAAHTPASRSICLRYFGLQHRFKS